MIEKVTLSRVFISDKNKDGELITDGRGKPIKKIAIKTEEHGENVWLTSLIRNDYSSVFNWKIGDAVEIIVEEKNGFTNFRVPNRLDILETRVEAIEKQLNIHVEEAATMPPDPEEEYIPF